MKPIAGAVLLIVATSGAAVAADPFAPLYKAPLYKAPVVAAAP